MNTYQLANLVYIDVETTGLNPALHGLLEIGACHISGHEFSSECAPHAEAEMDPEALAVNGTDPRRAVLRATSDVEAVMSLDGWVRNYVQSGEDKVVICSRNPAFDVGFLRAAFTRAGLRPSWLSHRHLDVTTLLYQVALLSGMMVCHELLGDDGYYRWLGIEEEPKPHRALTGAQMALSIHVALTRRMEDIKGLGSMASLGNPRSLVSEELA